MNDMNDVHSLAENLLKDVQQVPRLFSFLDPWRYTFLSFYPRWQTLPESRSSAIPQALDKPFSLYIHIPFCAARCPGCMYKTMPCGRDGVTTSVFENYLTSLEGHLNLYLEGRRGTFTKCSPVVNPEHLFAIYIGGGTPSLLNSEQIRSLLKMLESKFGNLRDLDEVSFECHPGSFLVHLDNKEDHLKLDVLNEYCGRKLRISLGVQSVNPELCSLIRCGSTKGDPGYNARDLEDILGKIQETITEPDFLRVNLDFMFGYSRYGPFGGLRAHDTEEEHFRKQLEKLVSPSGIRPNALTFYQLWHGTDRPKNEKEPKQLREARGDFEENALQIIVDRLQIDSWLCSEKMGYLRELGSLYVDPDHAPACQYHSRSLYGNENFIAIGYGSYAFIEGFSYMTHFSESAYRKCIIEDIHPVGLGKYLDNTELSFRRAILDLKSWQRSVNTAAVGIFIGQSMAEDMVSCLIDAKLAEKVETSGLEFRLTQQGFLLADEIASWFLTAPPLQSTILAGKARSSDSMMYRFFEKSPDDEKEFCEIFCEVNEQLDEFFRSVFKSDLSEEPNLKCHNLAVRDGRYVACLAALQSLQFNRPVFASQPYFGPCPVDEQWVSKDEIDAMGLGGAAKGMRYNLRWNYLLRRYTNVRMYYDALVSKGNERPLSLSVFGIFFAAPRNWDQDEGHEEIFLHSPPVLHCDWGLDEDLNGIHPGIISIGKLMTEIGEMLYEHGGVPLLLHEKTQEERGQTDECLQYWDSFLERVPESQRNSICDKIYRILLEVYSYRAGILDDRVRRRVDPILKRLAPSQRRKEGGLSGTQFGEVVAIFMLYWTCLPRIPSWVLHVPLLGYERDGQGGAIVFLQGNQRPNFAEINVLQEGVNNILGRIAAREMAYTRALAEANKERMRQLEERANAVGVFSHQVGHVLGEKSKFPLTDFEPSKITHIDAPILAARRAQIKYAALLPDVYRDCMQSAKDTASRLALSRRVPVKSFVNEVWWNYVQPLLQIVKQEVADHNSKDRLTDLNGLDNLTKDYSVPHWNFLKAALFEMLWNAFEKGYFGPGIKSDAIVDIRCEIVDRGERIVIVVENPYRSELRHTGTQEGIKYLKKMIESYWEVADRYPESYAKLHLLQFRSENVNDTLWRAELSVPG
jgi:coproporphyrinogen III oxidase-like Fe-S oxidoreductase